MQLSDDSFMFSCSGYNLTPQLALNLCFPLSNCIEVEVEVHKQYKYICIITKDFDAFHSVVGHLLNHDDIWLLVCRLQIVTTPLQPSMNIRRGRFLDCNDEPVVGRLSLFTCPNQMMTIYLNQLNLIFGHSKNNFRSGSGVCRLSLWHLLACWPALANRVPFWMLKSWCLSNTKYISHLPAFTKMKLVKLSTTSRTVPLLGQ